MKGRPLLTLFMVVFIDLLGFGVVIPLLPLYARDLDASGFEVGLLVTSYSAAQFVAAPYLGSLSDRVGRRPVLTLSLWVGAGAYALFGLADTLWVLFVARMVAGLCGGNIATAQAYIADVSSPAERVRAMGLIGAAFGLGFVLGPAIGGLFSGISASAPFFVAAGTSGVAAVLCATQLEEPADRQSTRGRAGNLRLLKQEPRLARWVACFFVTTFAFTHLEAVFSIYTAWRFRLDSSEIAYLFTYIGILLVFVQGVLIRPLSRRLDTRTLLGLGVALMALGLTAVPMAATIPWLVLALGPVALGNGLAIPSILALISRAAPGGRQGQTQGVGQAASGLARVIGPVSAGALYELVAPGSAFTAAGVVMVGGLLLVALGRVKDPTAGDASV